MLLSPIVFSSVECGLATKINVEVLKLAKDKYDFIMGHPKVIGAFVISLPLQDNRKYHVSLDADNDLRITSVSIPGKELLRIINMFG